MPPRQGRLPKRGAIDGETSEGSIPSDLGASDTHDDAPPQKRICQHDRTSLLKSAEEEIDVEVEYRSKRLLSLADEFSALLDRTLSVQLSRVPPKYRTMSYVEFLHSFSGDIRTAVDKEAQKAATEINTFVQSVKTPRLDTAKKSRNYFPSSTEGSESVRRTRSTNAGGMLSPLLSLPMSGRRSKAEALPIISGSSDSNSSLITPRRSSAAKAVASSSGRSSILVSVEGRGEVDLSLPGGHAALDGERKRQAMEQLRELQDKMADIMKELQGK